MHLLIISILDSHHKLIGMAVSNTRRYRWIQQVNCLPEMCFEYQIKYDFWEFPGGSQSITCHHKYDLIKWRKCSSIWLNKEELIEAAWLLDHPSTINAMRDYGRICKSVLQVFIIDCSTSWNRLICCIRWMKSTLIYALHYVFILRINRAVAHFIHGWNQHLIRAAHNKSPHQLFTAGMLILRHSRLIALDFLNTLILVMVLTRRDPCLLKRTILQ